MPALNFILPAANLAAPNDGGMATPPARHGPGGERFDQVMTRALSPSETDEPTRTTHPTTTFMVPDDKKQNPISAKPQRRRVQTQNQNAAPKNAAPAASKTSATPVQLQKDKSGVPIAGNDVETNKGNAATGSDAQKANQIASGNMPGFVIQLVAVPPVSTISLLPITPEKKLASEIEAIPLDSTSPLASGTTKPGGIGALPAGTGDKISDPETSPSKAAAKLISSLKPDEQQKTAANTNGTTTGKINPGEFQPVSLPAGDLNHLDFASEPAIYLPQNEISPSTDSSTNTTTLTTSASNGISAAKQYLPMKNTDKLNKVAGSTGKTEKVLPGNADSEAPENNLPTAELLARISPRNGSATITIGPSTKVPDPVTASSAGGASAASVVGLGSRSLERTHDMVAMQAVRLVDSKLDSLSVVIKPGAGTQLSLELRQHGDTIEAQVTLQRGDFGHLSQHWPELQQRLEQRGVRLAPLTGSENSTTDGGAGGFQQSQRESANPDPLATGAFVEFALAKSAVHSTTTLTAFTTAQRGWESWA